MRRRVCPVQRLPAINQLFFTTTQPECDLIRDRICQPERLLMRSNFTIRALIAASLFGAALCAALATPAQAEPKAEPKAGSKPVQATAAMKKPTTSQSLTITKP